MDYKQKTNIRIQRGSCFLHIYRRDSSKAINQMLPKAETLIEKTGALHKLSALSFLLESDCPEPQNKLPSALTC